MIENTTPISENSNVLYLLDQQWNEYEFFVSDEAAQERKENYIECKGWNDGQAQVRHQDWFDIYDFLNEINPSPTQVVRVYTKAGEIVSMGCLYQYRKDADYLNLS